MIDVRPYEQGDAFRLNPSSIHDNEELIQHYAEMMHKNINSRVFTLCINKLPIAVIGATRLNPRTWEVSSIMSDGIKLYPIEFARAVRRILESSSDVFGAARFQSLCRAGNDANKRFLEFLGFSFEGTLRGYGAMGDDYHIYARLF